MITVDEIRKKSLNIYTNILRSHLEGIPCFPKNIRSDKSLSKDFVSMSQEIAEVMANSKGRIGYGYEVNLERIKTRNHGFQDIPKSIVFETELDYLKFTGRLNEYEDFKSNCELILETVPKLKEWLIKNSLSVISNADNWKQLLVVCRWFLDQHEPGKFYIREIPIPVHTKFIESNIGILKSLLDYLIPEKTDILQSNFEMRFGLKYAEPCIRLRILDPDLYIAGRFKDISIPLHEFVVANFECENIFITENKMNFLTFPIQKRSIVVWGGGFAIVNLKNIDWLKRKSIFYWGDIDVHGFEILSQLRGYYNNVQSIMMDGNTLQIFTSYHGKGSKSKTSSLKFLTDEEQQVYQLVYETDQRLEQEKIPQTYINEVIRNLKDIV